eukprot:513593_1
MPMNPRAVGCLPTTVSTAPPSKSPLEDVTAPPTPSKQPTIIGVTSNPSKHPSLTPINEPSDSIHPTSTPTVHSTPSPSIHPTSIPTDAPSHLSSSYPSFTPTDHPIVSPTNYPLSSTLVETNGPDESNNAHAEDEFISNNILPVIIAIFLSIACCIIVVVMHQKQRKQKEVLRLARAHLETLGEMAE